MMMNRFGRTYLEFVYGATYEEHKYSSPAPRRFVASELSLSLYIVLAQTNHEVYKDKAVFESPFQRLKLPESNFK